MSEGSTEVANQEEAKASKRKMLSFGERMKVVDYLRSLVEPIVADSNTAVAAIVSVATGVEINWSSLKYMIDDPSLAELKLSTKVHVKSLLSAEGTLEARVTQLEMELAQLAKIVAEHISSPVEEYLDKAGA